VKTEDELLPWPWPFAQWNGTRWVMPAELMPKELRKRSKKRDQEIDLDEIEEAPF
jgi:hypothetical protein